MAAKVLAIVSGITGYPEDMLDLELDLEADLGIDTVKQAETFAAVRGEYVDRHATAIAAMKVGLDDPAEKVAAAVAAYEAIPPPEPEEIFAHVYADLTPALAEQQAELKARLARGG